MTITQMPCNPGNYTAKRSSAIRYLVVHYTGAPGTARNNGAYFASRGDIGASAHYFVDAQDIVQSVPDGGRAWHCGAAVYKHPECRNDNSIGVELCSYQDAAGRWRFDPATVENAVQLVRSLMAQYGIGIDHVVRHYDVTGKVCPEPYVRDSAAWDEFKARLTAPETTEDEDMSYEQYVAYRKRYDAEMAAKDASTWASESARNAILSGVFADGDADGLLDNPQAPVTREQLAAVLDRAGILAAGDSFVARYDETPAWAQPTIRELLDNGTINGGTTDNPDDINMWMSDIKVVCIIKRMIDGK